MVEDQAVVLDRVQSRIKPMLNHGEEPEEHSPASSSSSSEVRGKDRSRFHRKVSDEVKTQEVVGKALRQMKMERRASDLEEQSAWYVRWAIHDENRFRIMWNVWLVLLLAYTGTVFPYKLAFIDFGIPEREIGRLYTILELVLLDLGFYIDLLINFFFTYRDSRGRQIFDLRKIGKRYLKTYFFVNLIACIPPMLFSSVVCWIVGSEECNNTSVNQVGRLSRMQRFSRMARLVRLTRLGKLGQIVTESKFWREMASMRGVQVVNQCFGLLFVVHLVACGWWITASLHTDLESTWLNRRPAGPDGESLLVMSEEGEYDAPAQWLTTMYFVLTIFTTVGFGDMSALTVGEMIYVCVAMVTGIIVNGIILSEVITILTRVDEDARMIEDQERLMNAFGMHMQISPALTHELTKWVTRQRMDQTYNRVDMKHILTSGLLPRHLLNVLPQALYSGRVVGNSFINGSAGRGRINKVPPRFPLLVALSCQHFIYDFGQAVYQAADHAWNVYLVMRGTFAYVALPGSGELETDERHASIAHGVWSVSRKAIRVQEDSTSPYQLFGVKNYFGDLEIIWDTCPRISSVTCQSNEGSCLVLHKRDLFMLIEEFPLLASHWRSASKRRARHRRILHARLVEAGTYKELAVKTIQQHFRMLNARRGTARRPPQPYDLSQRPSVSDGRRSKRHVPAEVVPQYARNMQGAIDDLYQELQDLQAEVMNEIRDLQLPHSGIDTEIGPLTEA